MTRKEASFTLIELLIVISIIVIIGALVIVSVSSARAKSRDSKRVANLSSIQGALELYYSAHNNSYPKTGLDLANARTISSNGSCDPACDIGDYGPYTMWEELKIGLLSYLPSLPQDPAFEKNYTDSTDIANPASKPFLYTYKSNGSSYLLTAHLEENDQLMTSDGGSIGNLYEVYSAGGKALLSCPILPTDQQNKILISEVYYDPDVAHCPSNCIDPERWQWVELYNPTNNDINVSNWTIERKTASGDLKEIINSVTSGEKIKSHGYGVIARYDDNLLFTNNMWPDGYWNESMLDILLDNYGVTVSPTHLKVSNFSSLFINKDNNGSRLILRNSAAQGDQIIDQFSWGKNVTIPVPHILDGATQGQSIKRVNSCIDTDQASDFEVTSSPTFGAP